MKNQKNKFARILLFIILAGIPPWLTPGCDFFVLDQEYIDVSEQTGDMTDAEAVAADKNNLNIIFSGADSDASVTQNVVLPVSGSSGTTISWASSNTDVIAVDGSVTRPSFTVGDTSVTLTATISHGSVNDTKVFNLLVIKAAQTDAEFVATDKAALLITFNGSDSTNFVTQDITLTAYGANGTTISWVSGNTTVLANNGEVTRPSLATGDVIVNLTATITKGSAVDTKVFVLTVKCPILQLATYQTTCWDGLGNVISCAGTGQDGELQLGRAANFTGPTQHSTFVNDYTTTDNDTGLIWKSCSEGLSGASCSAGVGLTTDWSTAITSTCTALNSANSGAGYAGITTWRLPTIEELDTIIKISASYPAAFAANFPLTVLTGYWSASTFVSNTTYAWLGAFVDGRLISGIKTSNLYSVRCVSVGI
jgi:hypothetical protein